MNNIGEAIDNLKGRGSGKINEKSNQHQEKVDRPPSNVPICPFMSTPDKKVPCDPQCKLYRSNRPGYECYFQELQSIAWNTRQNPRQN